MEDLGDLADKVAAGEGVASGVGLNGGAVDLDGEGAAVVGFDDDSAAVFGGEVAALEVAESRAEVVVPHGRLLCSTLTLRYENTIGRAQFGQGFLYQEVGGPMIRPATKIRVHLAQLGFQ